MEGSLGAFGVFIVTATVLLLPGLAWLVLFRDQDQDPLEQLAGVIGVSIALTALTALGFFFAGLKFSTAGLVGIYSILAAIIVGSQVYRRIFPNQSVHSDSKVNGMPVGESGEPPLRSSRVIPAWLYFSLLLGVLCLIVAYRFYQVRDLVVPSWVDSVHHVVIVQAMLENRGVPDTLDPYLPIPFYYHYAFHALSAVFTALAQVPPHQSVLWVGQMLNAAVALAIYRLGKALWGDWRRAGLGMLLIGFVSQMPAYYATWGRYTLLTGLVLLPLAMATAQDILHKGVTRSRLATMSVLVAGLLLSHYYAALLLAAFLVFCVGQALIEDFRADQRVKGRSWLSLIFGVAVGFLLAAPWLYRMWGHAQSDVKVGVVSLSMQAVEDSYYPGFLAYLWHLLGPRRNYFFLLISLGGLPIAMRRRETRAFAVWALVLGLLTLPWGVHLAPFRPDHAAIVLFLPAALLLADLILTVIDWLATTRFSRIAVPVALLLVIALITWGAWETRKIVNPATILATPSDLQAIDWIEANVPESARFLINVTHWQYGFYRGVDGGWWIGPLTGRETLLPAALYNMGDEEYFQQVNEYARKSSELQGCSPEFWDLVRQTSVTHIYLNQAKGNLKAENLQNCPNLAQVYQEGEISIYQILEQSSSVQDQVSK